MSDRFRPDPSTHIVVVNARTNNLREVTVAVPRGRVTVFTGVSGSGKSSLVFHTIAAEAQRQANESYPSFVRNRLPHHPKPDADRIDGLHFPVVIDQRRFSGNARSTVGTASDIAPLLRVLFSRAGRPHIGYSPAFSFNDPSGMCPRCEGLGEVTDIDVDALIDPARSLNGGAVRFPAFAPGTYRWKRCVHSGLFDPDLPLGDYPPDRYDLLLNADGHKPPNPGPEFPRTGVFHGVLTRLRRDYLTRTPKRTTTEERAALDRVVRRATCPDCAGTRLNDAARSSLVDGRSIADWSATPVRDLVETVRSVTSPKVAPVVAEITSRLAALDRVGLGYLTLDRDATTLSGGEAQRVRLVRHLGSSLTGLCYVLDEPSAGLHPHDVHRLAELVRDLRDRGNTVLIVEHDPDLVAVADHVVDMGPGAGDAGGTVLYTGTLDGLRRADTPTGRHLRRTPSVRSDPRVPTGHLTVGGAREHNLKNVTVDVPTGVLTAVTGVAGSGKSTLATRELPRRHPQVAVMTQAPIRASGRSTPATFLDVLDPIRDLFARTHGVPAAHFSANSRGACPECRGRGVVTTELAFLDDVETGCEACGGTRFNQRTLGYTIDGRTIADVLGMTARTAQDFFADTAAPAVADALARLDRVGLGHLTLGRGLDTLSGGERQRLRLARELAGDTRHYVFDEPTTGLHGTDTQHLLALFDDLVDHGRTVVVIEHNLDVVAHADHVIDLGPGAGDDGGTVTFTGPPARLAAKGTGPTADALRRFLRGGHRAPCHGPRSKSPGW
ncbi:excinuclease ABC subunit UvrA [Thermobifida halotolerans]|uniref:UvrABC system protein A n=1 Tax=Thermobifida halotolerans TaxID=483545 RepID=A0AA97LZN1_9ACTN|nr:excinuclease ABC subunit UvrA [Thermobifida halotolerans]UOE21095.1 excinuclease ABC subunit UvrA [Thermobifida halotolerans]